MSVPLNDPKLRSVDTMPEHSDSGSGRSISLRASSCHLNVYLLIKCTSAIHTNYAL
jgi:hypothetical protein